jgi:phosphomannomutase
MPPRPRIQSFAWEGVTASTFTLDSLQRRCERVAESIAAHQWSCLVAYDTRFMSDLFARDAYHMLLRANVAVHFCATPTPFPVIAHALEQRLVDSALLVSAANRPYWYNGLQLLAPLEESPFAVVDDSVPAVAAVPFPAPPLDSSDQVQLDVRSPYIQLLRDTIDIELIRRATLTVFVDPMSGTTSGYVPAILGDGSQTKAIEINREIDPLFARHSPQPTEAPLNRLRKLVRESDSHCGLALSADGVALGVADTSGELVPSYEIALLLAEYLHRQYRQRGAVILPTLNEQYPDMALQVRAWEESTGLKAELVGDPAARIAELMGQDRNSVLVGCTPQGEFTLGRYRASADAIVAAFVLLEYIARAGTHLRALLDALRSRVVK